MTIQSSGQIPVDLQAHKRQQQDLDMCQDKPDEMNISKCPSQGGISSSSSTLSGLTQPLSNSLPTRGVYSSLFRYNHIDKKLPLLADFIKN